MRKSSTMPGRSLISFYLPVPPSQVATSGLSVVRADMDETLAYNITKGVIDNVDAYRSAHRLLKAAVTLESLSEPGAAAPFHPGALKYFKQKGLAK